MQEKMLYRVEEAGQVLSMGRSSTFELVRTGELPSVKIGRARRITAAALAEYVARLTDQAGAPAA